MALPEQSKCLMNNDLLKGYAQGRVPYGVMRTIAKLARAADAFNGHQCPQPLSIRVYRG